MNAPDGPVWFVGDLDDPWVGAIADAVPGGVLRHSCAGELPECLFRNLPPPRALVLHRAAVRPGMPSGWPVSEAARRCAPRVILCVGPHARHADLERWSSLLDVVVPEATARETIARHVAEGGERTRPSVPRPRISVVSGHLRAASGTGRRRRRGRILRGGRVRMVGGGVGRPGGLGRPGPGDRLDARAGASGAARPRRRADRVRRPGAGPPGPRHGASACLELPCDPADLIWALDRLAARRVEPAHDVPPAPVLASRPTGRRTLDTSARRIQEPPDATRPVVSFPRGGRPRPRGLQ